MRSPTRASWAILALAALAAATLVVEGGRPFGRRLPELDGSAARAGARREAKGESLWLVAGPFRAEGLSGLEDALDVDYLAGSGMASQGEASAAPLRVGSMASRLWRESGGGADGVDFLAELGPSSYSVAYAYREVEAPSGREVALRLGSDDGVKVWINGSLVLANHLRRALLPDEDSVLVRLAKGRNRILVKVGQAEGAWGFRLSLAPLSDRLVAAAPSFASIAAYPESLAVPSGGTIRGAVMPKPALYEGLGGEATAVVELLDATGAVRASAPARLGRGFSMPLPPGLSGPFSLRARGDDALAKTPSPAISILVGDPASSARRGASLARSAAAADAARRAGIPDPAATLEFLALSLEGKVPKALADFEGALRALTEIEAIAGTGEARGSFPDGLWRYAFASPLDGSLQPYSLYLPKGYGGERRYGLLVELHGASTSDYAAAVSVAAASPPDMLVLAPYSRGDLGYTGAGERDAIDAIDLVEKRYAIDLDRVYLSGSSMGGFGAWRLAKLYPWRFAAVATFAGWTSLDMLENLLPTPLLAVHGDADPTVPPGPDRGAVDFLASKGGKARFVLLPGAGHDAFGAWTGKTGPGRLLDWLRQRRRDPWPRALELRTTMARAGRGSWAAILGIADPPRPAGLDARIVDERHISVDTENVAAFELDLRHPGLAKGGRILILADGFNLTADSGRPSARFELADDGRFVPAAPWEVDAPPNGGSGMGALFDAPLRLIYGAAKRGRASDEEGAARAIADELGKAGIGKVAVVSDTEASKGRNAESSPEASTTTGARAASPSGASTRPPLRLLLGSPVENSELARLAPRLPLAWKDGRFHSPDGAVSGSGLVLVCPDPFAKGALVGVVALPPRFRGKAAEALARAIVAPMNDRYGQATCGYGTPDAILLDDAARPVWTGYFDWRWERLKAKAP